MAPMMAMRISSTFKRKILPGIRVRKNAIISPKNSKIRNREVKSQKRDLQMEKEKEIWI